MVLPHNLAVTTTQIPADAQITGSTPGDVNFPVHWVGRDQVMGFSIVRLGRHVPALNFAPLPASKWVVAVSPILTSSTKTPEVRVGEHHPRRSQRATRRESSAISRRSPTPTSANFVDAIAVNQSGQVVAVLSTNHLWYSAAVRRAHRLHRRDRSRLSREPRHRRLERPGRRRDGLAGHTRRARRSGN